MQGIVAAVASLLIVGQMAVCSPGATSLEMGIPRGSEGGGKLEARAAAKPTRRILDGDRRGDVLVRHTQSLAPVVNARALRRGGIRESTLPQSTGVRESDPAPWQSNRWYIIAGVRPCSCTKVQ
jgi:hypothetical protein